MSIMTNEFNISEIDGIVETAGRNADATVPILRAIQDKYNYLPEAALRRVCEITSITPAAIQGVSTFYSQFRHQPAGRHCIRICIGTACHVKGAETVYNAFRQYLNIPEGDDTDADRLFTVDKVACLGCCMLAPAVQIDDVTYGYVDSQKVPRVIKDFLASETHPDEGKDIGSRDAGAAGEVRLCVCSSCLAGGAGKVRDEFMRRIKTGGIAVSVRTVGCTGVSFEAPLVEVALADGRRFRYGRIAPENVSSVLFKHFRPVSVGRRIGAAASRLLEKLLTDETWEPVTRYAVDFREGPASAYWGQQRHLVTEHCGVLDPSDIDDYVAHNGFEALKKCLSGMTPTDVIGEIAISGLRGRGGAGFPTAEKWANVGKAEAAAKYIICNGDEGDPGAFMDRMVLESFPFRVIEGIVIAAYAVGAERGFIYIRAEYPLAIQRMRMALKMCRERNMLGDNAVGEDHSFDLDVIEGAGAFVCGEETALIAAIEGKRGTPRFRPPYPSDRGLWGKPTLVNNVETYALVPWIIRNGPQSFAALGTRNSKGTKTFALAGKIVRGGLIEVAMGMTLREIVDDIGGGIHEGRQLKAIQVGGPSGGCVPASLADVPVDYDDLVSRGAMMGSGGLVVLDDTDCMVDIARYFLSFTQMESCGKCTFCRIGTKRMLEILEALCEGRAGDGDIEKLEHLARITRSGSLCGLGRTAPNPMLSTLKYFRDEYKAHMDGRCPAKKCNALIKYVITDNCIGCTRCAQRCPVDAIPIQPYTKHEIDIEKCIKCDTCRLVCPSDAVEIRDSRER